MLGTTWKCAMHFWQHPAAWGPLGISCSRQLCFVLLASSGSKFQPHQTLKNIVAFWSESGSKDGNCYRKWMAYSTEKVTVRTRTSACPPSTTSLSPLAPSKTCALGPPQLWWRTLPAEGPKMPQVSSFYVFWKNALLKNYANYNWHEHLFFLRTLVLHLFVLITASPKFFQSLAQS